MKFLPGMMNYYKLKELIGLTVSEASFIVYPPLGEDSLDKVDISINLAFDIGDSITFTTDDNLWTQVIRHEKCIERESFLNFYERMDFWMNSEGLEYGYMKYEAFDLFGSPEFEFLFNEKIESIKLLDVGTGNKLNPYGVLLEFTSGNYLCSRSGFDGNMIQTQTFLAIPSPFKCFSFLGDLRMVDVQYLTEQEYEFWTSQGKV